MIFCTERQTKSKNDIDGKKDKRKLEKMVVVQEGWKHQEEVPGAEEMWKEKKIAKEKVRGGGGLEKTVTERVPEMICFLHEGHMYRFMDVQGNGWRLYDSLC